MNITTTTQNFDSSVALDTFVRSRLRNALTRLDADIIAIDVFMKDVNGPKGGVDKQALIRVQLRKSRQIDKQRVSDVVAPAAMPRVPWI